MTIPNFDSNEEKANGQVSEDLCDRLRSIWIDEVRKYHQSTTGRVSSYIPGPRLDGGCDSHGSIFKPIWPKLADFVKSHKLNAAIFIKAQFHNCKGRPPASPTMLLGPIALKKYETYKQHKPINKEVLIARDIQIRQTKDSLEFYSLVYLDKELAYRATLLDDNISLSALFRYCLAIQLGEIELANTFLIPAARQYSEDPEAYENVYDYWLTDDLREVAMRV